GAAHSPEADRPQRLTLPRWYISGAASTRQRGPHGEGDGDQAYRVLQVQGQRQRRGPTGHPRRAERPRTPDLLGAQLVARQELLRARPDLRVRARVRLPRRVRAPTLSRPPRARARCPRIPGAL